MMQKYYVKWEVMRITVAFLLKNAAKNLGTV